jgi:hypothetical protein
VFMLSVDMPIMYIDGSNMFVLSVGRSISRDIFLGLYLPKDGDHLRQIRRVIELHLKKMIALHNNF